MRTFKEMTAIVTKIYFFGMLIFLLIKKSIFEENWKSDNIRINKWQQFVVDWFSRFLVIESTAKAFLQKHDAELIAIKVSNLYFLFKKKIFICIESSTHHVIQYSLCRPRNIDLVLAASNYLLLLLLQLQSVRKNFKRPPRRSGNRVWQYSCLC